MLRLAPVATFKKSPASRLAVFTMLALASTALTAPVRATEFPAVIPLSSLDGTIGFRLDGAAFKDYSGWSVAAAGDVNGDAVADFEILLKNFSNIAGLTSIDFIR